MANDQDYVELGRACAGVCQTLYDPNDETAALLCFLIYRVDNTTFGNNVPTFPQWTGPFCTITQVQVILFTSLAVSPFSAFLTMLGKSMCLSESHRFGGRLARCPMRVSLS
jgi:hypothetical protein